MLDQLIKLVEQNAGKVIVQNDAVPNQHNNAAIKDVATQIFDGLKGQVSQGNVQEVVSMFQSGQSSLTNNPMVTQLITKVAGSLASKFGVSQQQAQSIATSLIPVVMNKFVDKTNDTNDNDFNLQDIMKNFTGNNNFDVGSLLGSDKAKDMLGGLGKMFGG